MVQPEICFVNKLIRMRLVAERLGGNRKPNVAHIADKLKILIAANKYSKPNESKLFFIRHVDSIEYLIPSGKPKLRDEFNNYNMVK